jgi:hypothetical protein
VNVSDKRDIHFLNDFSKSSGVCPPGHGDSDQSAAGLNKLIDLPYAAGNISGRDFRHRLDNNRGGRADFYPAARTCGNASAGDLDDLCFSSFNHTKIVACFVDSGKSKYHYFVLTYFSRMLGLRQVRKQQWGLLTYSE